MRKQPQGEYLVRLDKRGHAVFVTVERLSILLKKIGAPDLGQWEPGREGQFAPAALALVEAHDQALAVLSLLDGFDDDVGAISGD